MSALRRFPRVMNQVDRLARHSNPEVPMPQSCAYPDPWRRIGLGLFATLALACNAEPSAGPTDLGTAPTADANKPPAGAPLVLRGTVVTPGGFIKHGYVAVAHGRITSVSAKQPDIPGAVSINADGIIIPGFVDVHNHVPWNALPRWSPGRTFANRYQWRADPAYLQAVGEPFGRVAASHFCDMNSWGELRALVGGTTSILATQPDLCIHGLVRNLDFNSGFYGTTELDREHIINVLGVPLATDPSGRAAFAGAASFFIANPFFEALVIHVAEGTDALSEEEFSFLQSQSLLNSKGVIIHGISLGAADFQAMAASGTALVWSPRSNLELYGTTADISSALNAGVEVALAPDWAITGSSNMLDELKTAAQWNRQHLGGRLTPRQLVDMVTSAPAHIAGVEDEVGSIRAGLRADLVVIAGDPDNPYGAVLDARPRDIQMVLIEGVPLYGDRTFLQSFWAPADLEQISLPDGPKTLATPAAAIVVAGVAARLQAALQAEGTSLAPLTETAAR
jgi:5-methylthioadenosine/S-adenosylhomocysteine deaminase